MKKIILIMAIALVIISMYAVDYQINCRDDLELVVIHGSETDAVFHLNTDIQFAERFSIPMLCGTFEGHNYTIRNLYSQNSGDSRLGFINHVSGGTIRDLNMVDGYSHGYSAIGLLGGYVENSYIENCHVEGLVSGYERNNYNGHYPDVDDYEGGHSIGGLIGSLRASTIINCSSDVTALGSYDIGGLVGKSFYSDIYNSFSDSSILTTRNRRVGGAFIGIFKYGEVRDCYSTLTLIAPHGEYNSNPRNSFIYSIEDSSIYNCYGLISPDSPSASCDYFIVYASDLNVRNSVHTRLVGTNSIYSTHGINSFINLVGAQIDEMQDLTTYLDIGWDFVDEDMNGTDDIWSINPDINDGFPYLTDLEYMVPNLENINPSVVSTIKLFNAYPNPFQTSTEISFKVDQMDEATIEIYNIKGQLVKSYPTFGKGKHHISWDGFNTNRTRCTSGVYFYRLISSNSSITKKMVLLKE